METGADVVDPIAGGVTRGADDLEFARDELAMLLEINQTVTKHLDRDDLFGALAGCLQTVVPTDRFGIELPIADDMLQGHLLGPLRATPNRTRPEVLPAAGTVCSWVLHERHPFVSATRGELQERFPVTFQVMTRENMEALCALPLVTDARCRGVLFFMAARAGAYANLRRGLLEQVAGAVAVALDNALAHEEVERLRDRLAAENVYLQEEIRQEHNFREIVGRSPALMQVLSRVEAAAPTPSTVLILGESGTGKELIARAIHDRSPRRERPLVKVNCSAISAGLVESELFGHVRGAFTGAAGDRTGRFELAHGGTIFLDEIGELAPETQAKLLRVLQEREFEPVGSSQ
ncbi:MAG: sigma 54-interacting transcriptional regulator, partial [Candidatus Binatia bacterium]